MATYEEIRGLVEYTPLRHAVQTACVDVAVDIFDEVTPDSDRIAWANAALEDPVGTAKKIIHYVLILNQDSTVETIKNAATNKTAIKNNVAAAVAAIVAPVA